MNQFFSTYASAVAEARKRFGRPLTLTEKILAAHLDRWPESGLPVRGETFVFLRPDRVAMQDATAQMALLQFIQAGLSKVAVPTTIHCDHLIRAKEGAHADLKEALGENAEVYDFLKSAAAKYGIGFGAPGTGIIHQVILENLATPGELMLGTDSHTPNAGGLSMVAIGVGGADAVEVMAGQPWGTRWPRLIGVRLTGKFNGWTSAKDVILKLSGILGAAGGTGAIIEYFGDGVETLSCTGKATIANMGAELGATTSIFPYSDSSDRYLRATARAELADAAAPHIAELRADPEMEQDAAKYFDRLIEIDLSTLEPHIVGPFTPDLARPVSAFAGDVKDNGYPEKLRYALIGSCTNSSYEDISRAAHIARQARKAGLKAKCGLLITPGSAQVKETIEREGLLEVFQSIGGIVLANACGPCIGQWQRGDVADGEPNSIINSFNRPFRGRNDNNNGTHAFIASPEVVIAYALAGNLSFNPLADELTADDGTKVRLEAPFGDELPAEGFALPEDPAVSPPSADGNLVQLIVKPTSERLELLAPFAAWDGKDFDQLPVLVKAQGKCTTDHISPAGAQWLRYRGHLDRISNNMFSRVQNALTGEVGVGVDNQSGEKMPLHAVARRYKERGIGWIAVGDSNYGEGSSREHAAMSPRHLGCKAVIVRSFARIHQSNLWKQGILALTFVDPADYDKIGAGDALSISGLSAMATEPTLTVTVHHKDGQTETFKVTHGMTADQVEWFKAGSFLNLARTQMEKAAAETSAAAVDTTAAAETSATAVTEPVAAEEDVATGPAGDDDSVSDVNEVVEGAPEKGTRRSSTERSRRNSGSTIGRILDAIRRFFRMIGF